MEEKSNSGTTKSGYKYVLDSEGNKIRNSLVNRRLDEDDETYEEYKGRRKVIEQYEKDKKTLVSWPSVDHSDPMNPEKNLGNYNKEQVEEILRSQEQGQAQNSNTKEE